MPEWKKIWKLIKGTMYLSMNGDNLISLKYRKVMIHNNSMLQCDLFQTQQLLWLVNDNYQIRISNQRKIFIRNFLIFDVSENLPFWKLWLFVATKETLTVSKISLKFVLMKNGPCLSLIFLGLYILIQTHTHTHTHTCPVSWGCRIHLLLLCRG